MRRLLLAGAGLSGCWPCSPSCHAPAPRRRETPLPNVKWSFDGPFGTFDKASAQRGFQVYNEVCSACHSMRLMSYRNLEPPSVSAPEQVKAIAASKTVPGPEDDDRQGQPPVRACPRIISSRRSRTTKPPAPPITARCRRTSR